MDDPYKLLGVEKTASEDEIRKAYRKLAKEHHPDLNPGKKDVEEKFKAINAAHELLSDKEKRAKFDRGEIDASGAEVHPERRFYRDFGEDFGRSKYRPNFEGGGFEADDLSSIFEELLRQRGGPGGGAREFAMRGQDARYQLAVDFLDAAKGAVRRLTLPDGSTKVQPMTPEMLKQLYAIISARKAPQTPELQAQMKTLQEQLLDKLDLAGKPDAYKQAYLDQMIMRVPQPGVTFFTLGCGTRMIIWSR